MKAMLTLEGGLRIEAENPAEWSLLRHLVTDAGSEDIDLADRLGALIPENAGAEDWREYVVPDLREAFHEDVLRVLFAIEQAEAKSGPVLIMPQDAMAWYSTLNQARLAIEEAHQFGQSKDIDPSDFPLSKLAAFSRSRMYCSLQGLLLEHVMR